MITFGTDGWKARIDAGFNEENLIRIADAAARLWSQRAPGAIVYVGYDTRPDAERYAMLAGKVIASRGLVPKVSERYVPTPALSWMVANDARACGALQVTGAYGPSDYLGVKLRMASGAVLSEDEISELEHLIDPDAPEARGGIQRKDIGTPYFDYLCGVADAESIAAAHLKVVVDPLFGAARGYMTDLLGALGVEVVEIHGKGEPDKADMRPDPVEPWVDECERAVVSQGAACGLVIDGDGCRVAAVDERGRHIPSRKVAALLVGHLAGNRGLTGRVAIGQSTSMVVRNAAMAAGCRVVVKPAGPALLSGGTDPGVMMTVGEDGEIAIPSLCPGPDGTLAAALLCELAAKEPLGEITDRMDLELGASSWARRDVRLGAGAAEMLRTLLPGLNPGEVAGEVPSSVSHMDGLRLGFEDGSWLHLRPSLEEPSVRVSAEAPSVERRDALLAAALNIARPAQDV